MAANPAPTSEQANTGPVLLHTPTLEEMSQTQLAKFVDFVQAKHPELDFGPYGEACYNKLHDWSISHQEDFYVAVRDFSGLVGDWGERVIDNPDNMMETRFFSDSKISFAENMLKRVKDAPNEPAIISRYERGEDTIWSWQKLYDEVSRWEQVLKDRGVEEMDRVVVNMPNTPESVAIMLAASNLGAIFSSTGTELPAEALISRFGQTEPKVLIAADTHREGKKEENRLETIAEVQAGVPSIQSTIVVPVKDEKPDISGLKNAEHMDEALEKYEAREIEFIRRDFNHPQYILFSSGSSGKPKCFVHSAGGTLLSHVIESQLQGDVRAGDRVFYNTTRSWMMANWLDGNLASGATTLLYSGFHGYPDAYSQWDFANENGCTHFGTAAPLAIRWMNKGLNMIERGVNKALRVIMSTGDILPPPVAEYLHRSVAKVRSDSIFGGSDKDGCFGMGNPFSRCFAGLTPGWVLGTKCLVLDDDGNEVENGQSGELTCVTPIPSVLGFWNDPDNAKFKEAYFEHYEGKIAKLVWRHGDSVMKVEVPLEDGTVVTQIKHLGRSDDVLNQNGIKLSPTEIYTALDGLLPEDKGMAAISYQRPSDEQAITVLFVELDNPDAGVPDAMIEEIKHRVGDQVNPAAVPIEIVAVPSLARTPNGKTAGKVMKSALVGKVLSDEDASLYGAKTVRWFENFASVLAAKYPRPSNGAQPANG